MAFRILVLSLDDLFNDLAKELPTSANKMTDVDKIEFLMGFNDDPDFSMTVIGDKTKFNESIRIPLAYGGLASLLETHNLMTKELRTMLKVAANLYLQKSVTTGAGISVRKGGVPITIPIRKAARHLKGEMKDNYEIIEPYLSEDSRTVKIAPSMLMGMSTGAATWMALIATVAQEKRTPGEVSANKLQASDDFIIFAHIHDHENIKSRTKDLLTYHDKLIYRLSVNSLVERFFGFNDSIAKTYAFHGQTTAEYNSIFRLGDPIMIGENRLASLIPSGKNPVTDFQNIADILQEWAKTGACEPFLLPVLIEVAFRIYTQAYRCRRRTGQADTYSNFLEQRRWRPVLSF